MTSPAREPRRHVHKTRLTETERAHLRLLRLHYRMTGSEVVRFLVDRKVHELWKKGRLA